MVAKATRSRSYSSPLREADAAATRTRIVEAAARLFIRDGYAATPMRAIAIEAGVSIQSVHLAGPKHGLLLAAFERSFAGDEGRHSLTERPALIEIMAQPDAERALVGYVEFLGAANERSAAIVRALKAAADADPAAREAYRDLEQRRRRDIRLGAEHLAQRGLIAAAGVEDAAAVLGLLTSSEAYLHFIDAGWDRARYQAWLAGSLRQLLASGAA